MTCTLQKKSKAIKIKQTKMRNFTLALLLFASIFIGCKEEAPEIQSIDMALNSISEVEIIPEDLQEILGQSNARTLANGIIDMKEIKFTDDQNNETNLIGMELESLHENIRMTMYYDRSIAGITYMIEEVDLGNGEIQINYLSPDGNYLFMQLEGAKHNMQIKFMMNEENDAILLSDEQSARIEGCGWSKWGSNFVGCLGRLANNSTFRVVAVAGAIGGYGSFIAAGAVIGCGVGEAIPCLKNRNTSNNNCNSVVACGRSIPKNRLTNSGSVSFQFASVPHNF